MTAIRKEVLEYIESIPDSRLEALKPILVLLANDVIEIETDLTDEEKEIILQGRKEYAKGGFVSLDDIRL